MAGHFCPNAQSYPYLEDKYSFWNNIGYHDPSDEPIFFPYNYLKIFAKK